MIRNKYNFCSICGYPLQKNGRHKSCTNSRCSFVNYWNPRPTSTAIVVHNGKILLTKRKKEPCKNCWDLPGGFVDYGENPEKALRREMREELGLRELKKPEILGIYADTYADKEESYHVNCVIYVVKIDNAREIKIADKEELSAYKWSSFKNINIKKIAFASNQTALRDFMKYIKTKNGNKKH